MKQIKLAFVWDFTVNPVEFYSWDDGLHEALMYLNNKYRYIVKVFANDDPNVIYHDLQEFRPDVILGWGSLDRPSFAGIKQFGVPTALCFAGGPTNHPFRDNFDIIFVENRSYLEAYKADSYNVTQAFGTNHNLFVPQKLNKKYKACYPASFALWKRHNLFAEAVGKEGIAVGKLLEHELQCAEVCIKNGVTILPDIAAKALPFIYNQSEYTLVTAANIGGGQRNVLESMACNVPPIVMSDSDKNTEFVNESGFGLIVDPEVEAIKEALAKQHEFKSNGRDYILSKYSAEIYADKLHKGLKSVI